MSDENDGKSLDARDWTYVMVVLAIAGFAGGLALGWYLHP